MPKSQLPQITDSGDAFVVDISQREAGQRSAAATSTVVMMPQTLDAVTTNGLVREEVLTVARLAGMSAAKRTGIDLIALCHPVALSKLTIEFAAESPGRLRITATAEAMGRSGVEMEAMTAASTAALAVYQICKDVDDGVYVADTRLIARDDMAMCDPAGKLHGG